ncbi:hypothetical protein HMPREF9265_1200 [Limosilactobacillus oris PB013-T2-3]|uniref:Uncharacterized protein n=1 Tax=Limosilactobacillus oris PB013-T2-3 TaxID=908339 RepID=E3C7H1_9LACO|nr:hypothetical protein HMPREF9265_1200 [Limosilactobacillus oris PB013-T2-3]
MNFLPYLKKNRVELIVSLCDVNYKLAPVKQVEISKSMVM